MVADRSGLVRGAHWRTSKPCTASARSGLVGSGGPSPWVPECFFPLALPHPSLPSSTPWFQSRGRQTAWRTSTQRLATPGGRSGGPSQERQSFQCQYMHGGSECIAKCTAEMCELDSVPRYILRGGQAIKWCVCVLAAPTLRRAANTPSAACRRRQAAAAAPVGTRAAARRPPATPHACPEA